MPDGMLRERVSPSSASKRQLQPRLEELIHTHRFTIAVIAPVMGAILLVASAEGFLPALLAYNAVLILIGTLVMRSPLLVGASPLVNKRAGALLLGLVAYTYSIEAFAVETGLPYGDFDYLVNLGPMIAEIPLGLPLFFIPLVVNAYLLTILAMPTWSDRWYLRIPIAVALVLAIDLVLDPAAVAIGFWSFEAGGAYYGVPATNYLGWVISGVVAVVAIEQAVSLDRIRDRARECPFLLDDLVSFILLWGVINAIYLQVIPVVVTLGLLFGLVLTGRYDGFIATVLAPVKSR